MPSKGEKKGKEIVVSILTFKINEHKFDFQWKLHVYQKAVRVIALVKCYQKQSVAFPSYMVMVIRCKIIFIFIKVFLP